MTGVQTCALPISLVTIAERADDDWFRIEEYLARETDASTNTGTPPAVAGGAV